MPIIEHSFSISGMHCASCAVDIEKKIHDLPGVQDVRVNYADEHAYVSFDSDKTTVEDVAQVVKQLGYGVALPGEDVSDEQDLKLKYELLLVRIKLGVSVVLSALLMIGAMVSFAPALLKNHWVMWLLATPIQFWVGWRYYKSAWLRLKQGRANMDTLIALGTSVAYFYSVFVVFFPSWFERAGIPTHVYFEASATIITFILLGNYLEMRAKGRASAAIKKLIGLQPRVAMVRKDEQWVEISVEQVAIGDIILIKPGESVPVDGEIIKGESTMNESMVTGESKPVHKKIGDEVIGGTISQTGSFEFKATKVGAQTTLAIIVELVKKAQSSKASVQKLVDRISSVFVPIVIALSIVTFFMWYLFGPEPQLLYAVVSMVAVLIVACPCALGLATPTSLMVGMGRGAQEGILIKDAEMLERAGTVNVVLFDKTGTLTKGEQEVKDFQFPQDITVIAQRLGLSQKTDARTYVANMTRSIEQLSNHPVSIAVERYLSNEFQDGVEYGVDKFETVSGLGVRAVVDGREVVIGSARLMEQEGVKMTAHANQCALDWSKEAHSVSFVAFDKTLVAFFCVADTIRPEVAGTIARLHDMGIRTMMITGDNELAAQAVAKAIGIDQVFSQVLPQDKEALVRRLCTEGNVVAMVGDGINDAPALAAADIGIAMGSGTDVALETAGAALLRDDMSLVPKLIALSRATMKNITQNLVWAFGYNVILIPVAMGALYPLFGIMLNPMLAGASMAFSSVSVVLNALRLKRAKL